MDVSELEQKLKEINVPSQIYSILNVGLPNEQYCLSREGDMWEVYYSERGSKTGLKSFEDEGAACEYFYSNLARYGNSK